jgi:hypothetical protein
MHYLSSVYSVTTPLHVLGLLAAHHQEVTMCICNKLYVWYVLLDCRWVVPTRPADCQLRCTTCTDCCMYTLLLPDGGQTASPKHAEVQWLNKQCIKLVSLHAFPVRSELHWISTDVNIRRQQTKWTLTFSCSFGKRFIYLLKHGLAWLFERWHQQTGEEILTHVLYSWLQCTDRWVTQHLHNRLQKRKQHS